MLDIRIPDKLLNSVSTICREHNRTVIAFYVLSVATLPYHLILDSISTICREHNRMVSHFLCIFLYIWRRDCITWSRFPLHSVERLLQNNISKKIQKISHVNFDKLFPKSLVFVNKKIIICSGENIYEICV